VILWTRVTRPDSLDAPALVTWQMAADPSFASVLLTGTAIADTSHDYTVKVDVTGLTPGTY
jgi:alkaline phosphatase D